MTARGRTGLQTQDSPATRPGLFSGSFAASNGGKDPSPWGQEVHIAAHPSPPAHPLSEQPPRPRSRLHGPERAGEAVRPPPPRQAAGVYLGHNPLLPRLLPPHHGVRLPGASLPICKNAHVVAFEGVKQHLFSNVSVHLLLRCKLGVLGLGRWGQRLSRSPTRLGPRGLAPESLGPTAADHPKVLHARANPTHGSNHPQREPVQPPARPDHPEESSCPILVPVTS